MIYRVAEPAFTAVAIDRLQTILSTIQLTEEGSNLSQNLIQNIYPEIEISTVEETKGMAIFWLSKKDFQSVNPNDNYKSISFFRINDPIRTSEYFTEVNIDLIVWFNTDKFILNYRPVKHNIQGLVCSVLNEVSEVSNLSVYTEKQNIFTGELQQQNSFSLEAPFTGFRINFDYKLDTCTDTSFNANIYC